jgi:uncharacterized cupin superfamily protein
VNARPTLLRASAAALMLVGFDLYDSHEAFAASFDPVLEMPGEISVAPVWAAIFSAIAFVAALMAVSVLRAARYLQLAPSPSVEPVARPLGHFPVDASWIKSGTPVFKGTGLSQSADGKFTTGMWSCDGPGTFEWQYGGDEMVCLLEGQVHIEYLGRHFTLSAGDSAVFHAGTRAVWHVPQYARKVFTLQELDLPVRVWRRLLKAIR